MSDYPTPPGRDESSKEADRRRALRVAQIDASFVRGKRFAYLCALRWVADAKTLADAESLIRHQLANLEKARDEEKNDEENTEKNRKAKRPGEGEGRSELA